MTSRSGAAARQIFAISGVLTGNRSRTVDLIRYAVSLETSVFTVFPRPSLSREQLLAQDVIWVEQRRARPRRPATAYDVPAVCC